MKDLLDNLSRLFQDRPWPVFCSILIFLFVWQEKRCATEHTNLQRRLDSSINKTYQIQKDFNTFLETVNKNDEIVLQYIEQEKKAPPTN